jgi:hypothetical protein
LCAQAKAQIYSVEEEKRKQEEQLKIKDKLAAAARSVLHYITIS